MWKLCMQVFVVFVQRNLYGRKGQVNIFFYKLTKFIAKCMYTYKRIGEICHKWFLRTIITNMYFIKVKMEYLEHLVDIKQSAKTIYMV